MKTRSPCQGHMDILMAYAAGTLDDAHNLLISTYLTLSPEARKSVNECESLGGALIEKICEPEALSMTCLESMMKKLDALESCNAQVMKKCCNETCIETDTVLPAPLAAIFPATMERPQWHTTKDAAVRWLDIPIASGHGQARLLKCAAGHAIPGRLLMAPGVVLVLEGALSHPDHHFSRGELVCIEKIRSTHAVCALQGAFVMTVRESCCPGRGVAARIRALFSR